MRRNVATEVFAGMVMVALLSVGVAGLVARSLADAAFTSFLATAPAPGRMGAGMGAGRHLILTAAEKSFVAALDRGILIGAVIAFAFAAVAALVLAYYLTRPLERLTVAARSLAAGDLDHRVQVHGASEVERLAEAFNEMASSLEHGEELRRRLVADVAHEIRNPIAAIRAQAEGLAEGVLVPDAHRMDSMVGDARYLSRLVDDLQELSAADAGQLRYEMERVDVAILACRELETAAEHAGDTIKMSCVAEEAKTVVIGDESRLRQVLRNLLDNALKHTAAGEISVSVTTVDGSVEVAVRDTGSGISAEDLPYVFERFYRADVSRSARTGGAGIGLAISRRIVEDHGGEMFASSAPGEGSVFGFRLPVA